MDALRLGLLCLALAALGCQREATTVDAGDASSPGVCGSGFTACVHACGEKDDREANSATCANGIYSCPAPLIPAITCGESAWPKGPFAGCGPWVEGVDCTTPAVCVSGLWDCPGIPVDADASLDGGQADAGENVDADADAGADAEMCAPLASDAGVTSLDDLPLATLCMEVGLGVIRWDTPCEGSIVVQQGRGVDCAASWLFDATTKKLQATAFQCVGTPLCTGAVPGFDFPGQCLAKGPTVFTRLCQTDAGGG